MMLEALKNKSGAGRCLVMMKIGMVIGVLALMISSCATPNSNIQPTEGQSEVEHIAFRKIEHLDVFEYTIASAGDTIQYIKVGSDTTTAKPILIFLQGSLPVPLIINFEDFKHINIPFQYAELIKDFHLIEISMPHTPVEAGMDELNSDYSFITDTSHEHSFKTEYLKDNYLDKYVDRTAAVIADLLRKVWVKEEQIHLVGHSQGAKIAVVLAAQNEDVNTVSLLGFNAYGRFDESIRRERHQLRMQRISGEEYLSNLDRHYERWRDINSNPDDYENGNLNWTSFSIDYNPYLLKTDIPIFVGFGTEDISAENCDLLPLLFIENGKSNLTSKPYVGLEHNFFEVVEGTPDYKSGPKWTEVMGDVVEWIKITSRPGID